LIRVGVLGALGRMGRLVCRAVVEDPELHLVAAIDRTRDGDRVGPIIGMSGVDVVVSAQIETLLQAETEVAVDFTRPGEVMNNVRWAIDHAMDIVVGTSGIGSGELDDIKKWIDAEAGDTNVIVAPNFSVGAVVAQRFAEEAARFFPAAEIVELHHDQKVDAPSGTAATTAERIAAARHEAWSGPDGELISGVRGGDVDGVRVHSVRLPGLVAHQEVIFGALGQTLTIRHDALDRSCYLPGVLLAIKRIAELPGLTIGLEPLLGISDT
jgi:4-hydroxy-tetrahydrodipicolinate reductase